MGKLRIKDANLPRNEGSKSQLDNKHHTSDRDQGDVKATGILTREKLQHIMQMRDLMIFTYI